ncbi:MAG: benzoate/H(+) symporter BenE family transporter, partial [Desulfobacterales bacterium]|nr:benzoate/H(+) symporter BenE family transporter [Desulfobacterales bacterium]
PVTTVVAGLIVVAVSYGGPAALIFQAADAAGLDRGQLMSWIWAVSIGSGITGIYLSVKLKTPVVTAWSTPGAALLVTGWAAYSYPEAIGCFIFSGAVITLIGITGVFSRVMDRIPGAVVAAMLAGILFRFGTDVFVHMKSMPGLVEPMLLSYLISKRFFPRYAIVLTLASGFITAYFLGVLVDVGSVSITMPMPVFTMPQFTVSSLIGLGVPLCLVTMAGQNATGLAVIRAAGYEKTPANPMITVTGMASVFLAPFGAHGINLAAITAAICTGPDAHPEPGKRYLAGITSGMAYLLVGLFGTGLVMVFRALPPELIAVVAGVALFGAILSGLTRAMTDETHRESALITFLITASGVSFFGIGAAFWGLAGGLLFCWVMTERGDA